MLLANIYLNTEILLLLVLQAVVKLTWPASLAWRLYNTQYARLPDLLIDLEVTLTDDNYKKAMAKYDNSVALILDEWLLLKPTELEQRDIFELLHWKCKKYSTIFCSQYKFEK